MGDKGFFKERFDLDKDGELDSFERAVDFTTFVMMTKENEEDDALSLGDDDDFDDVF